VGKKKIEDIKDFFAGLSILMKIGFIVVVIPITIFVVISFSSFIAPYVLMALLLLVGYYVLRSVGSVARKRGRKTK